MKYLLLTFTVLFALSFNTLGQTENDTLIATDNNPMLQNPHNEQSMQIDVLKSQIKALNLRIENQKTIMGNFKLIMILLVVLLIVTTFGMIFFLLKYNKLAELVKKLPLQELLDMVEKQKPS